MIDLVSRERESCCDCERPCALAMAYVPSQQFGEVFSPETALIRGTLFPELDKPFCGRTVEGGYRRV